MTKNEQRDMFAAHAMTAIIENLGTKSDTRLVAMRAFEFADAMVNESEARLKKDE